MRKVGPPPPPCPAPRFGPRSGLAPVRHRDRAADLPRGDDDRRLDGDGWDTHTTSLGLGNFQTSTSPCPQFDEMSLVAENNCVCQQTTCDQKGFQSALGFLTTLSTFLPMELPARRSHSRVLVARWCGSTGNVLKHVRSRQRRYHSLWQHLHIARLLGGMPIVIARVTVMGQAIYVKGHPCRRAAALPTQTVPCAASCCRG